MQVCATYNISSAGNSLAEIAIEADQTASVSGVPVCLASKDLLMNSDHKPRTISP